MTMSEVHNERSPVTAHTPEFTSSYLSSASLAKLNARLIEKATPRHREAMVYVIKVFLTLLIVFTDRFSQ